jgi:hypothetical protein
MFWNEMTVDMMILFYIAGLFALILICLYALIQSKANKLYTFIIIPLALIMASMTWQGIKVLQGMPVHGLPFEEEVQILYIQDNKPWIFVLLQKESGPVLYKIEWTEENKKKMKKLKNTIGGSFAQGEFQNPKSNTGESESFIFTPMFDMSEPEEKRGSKEGITYEPARSTNTGLRQNNALEERFTICPQSQNFCDDDDDEPTIGGQ